LPAPEAVLDVRRHAVTPSDDESPMMKPARLLVSLVLAASAVGAIGAQTDLDAFMQQVLERRDDNWKKLQQYILDERESTELRGPGQALIWGQRSDYTWFIRDGFFVRSPLKVNGASVGEADRRKYEADFLKREQQREKRFQSRDGGSNAIELTSDDTPGDVDGLLRQTRRPGFISSSYFLRFRFDEGHYALVGRERLEDRDVLRIEYYPTKLFTADRRRPNQDDQNSQRRQNRGKDEAAETQMLQLLNKKSKVTLWIEPTSHQILKYTFDDLGWDFFPGQWLARVSDVTATMTVFQAFPDVWLPRGLQMDIGMLFAIGPVTVHYALDYHDYRKADVTTKVGIPGRP
jgi:hypothetical protein